VWSIPSVEPPHEVLAEDRVVRWLAAEQRDEADEPFGGAGAHTDRSAASCPRGPTDGGTGSQLIPGVGRTQNYRE
jgi:hypothetical protein